MAVFAQQPRRDLTKVLAEELIGALVGAPQIGRGLGYSTPGAVLVAR